MRTSRAYCPCPSRALVTGLLSHDQKGSDCRIREREMEGQLRPATEGDENEDRALSHHRKSLQAPRKRYWELIGSRNGPWAFSLRYESWPIFVGLPHRFAP